MDPRGIRDLASARSPGSLDPNPAKLDAWNIDGPDILCQEVGYRATLKLGITAVPNGRERPSPAGGDP
jgi:hypothetical protein